MNNLKNKKSVKLNIKTGDEVFIIAGKDKGKVGKVMKVDRLKRRVFVKDINLVVKHTKPSKSNPKGLVKKISASLDISNVSLKK